MVGGSHHTFRYCAVLSDGVPALSLATTSQSALCSSISRAMLFPRPEGLLSLLAGTKVDSSSRVCPAVCSSPSASTLVVTTLSPMGLT